MILQAGEVSRLLGVSPQPVRVTAAIILTIASGFLIFCAQRRTPWRRGAIEIDAPGPMLVLDPGSAHGDRRARRRGHAWVLLPSVGISFFAFAAIYRCGACAGRAELHSRWAWCIRSRNPLRGWKQRASGRRGGSLGDLSRHILPAPAATLDPPPDQLRTAALARHGNGPADRSCGKPTLHPSFSPRPPLPSARSWWFPAPCRPSSIGFKSSTLPFRSGRSRYLISLPASPVSSCYSPRMAYIAGSMAPGGSLCP